MSRYRKYPAYKDSGVEWIGEIPEHWEVKRLRFVTILNPSKKNIKLADNQLVSFVPMDSVCEYGGIEPQLEKELSEVNNGYTFFANNDIVIAKITPCFENGKGALAKNLTNTIAFGTTELHVLRSKKSILPEFLFYLSISYPFRALGESTMYGAGGQKRIPETFIKDFFSPIPLLEEQQAIASFLDRKTAQIDELISKKEELLKQLDEKRSTFITQAVTKGLDLSVPMKNSGVDWLGKIPKHWEVKRGRFTMQVNPQSPILRTLNEESEVSFIAMDAVKEYGGLCLDQTQIKSQVSGGYTEFQEGDVVVAKITPCFENGKGALAISLVNSAAFGTTELHVLRPIECLDNRFLFFLTITDGFRKLGESTMYGAGGQKRVPPEFCKDCRLPLPSVKEQRVIVKQIEKKTVMIDRQKQQITEAIEHLKEYRSALITDAVTGKMDVHLYRKRVTLSA